jgi:hypothetical protein
MRTSGRTPPFLHCGMQPTPQQEWQATRAQTVLATQLLRDRDDDDDAPLRDIGRRIDAGQRELFVSCGPAEALLQQLELLQPEFIALHDVGASASRRLVAGVATALGVPLQKLVIRRHGSGVVLATLEFVELPVDGRRPLRLYSTQVEADTQQRHALARLLLAHSRLAALIVGDLPAHALTTALQPLADAIATGPWLNRQLLMMPLASASSLPAQATALGRGGVTVRITPQVARPNDAWNYLVSSWQRLIEQLPDAGLPALDSMAAAREAAAAAPAGAVPVAPPAPLPMRPMPPIRPAAAAPAPAPGTDALLQRYVDALIDIKGMISACVFEPATQRSLSHAGARPGPAMLAAQGTALSTAMLDASRALGFGTTPAEAAITLGGHHLLLRPLPGRPTQVLHLVLDKSAANLTLARLHVLRQDELLVAVAED